MSAPFPGNPPLIDVDCNLWHKDLVPLLPSASAVDGPWSILAEDDVAGSNIVAMLSPSSTVQEAREGIAKLSVAVEASSHGNTVTKPPIEIRTTVGIHPYHVNDKTAEGGENSEPTTVEYQVQTVMKNILTDPVTRRYCAAVGECGLDASDGFPPIRDQIPWFRSQARLAQELGLPLFVHERSAFAETMEVLQEVTVPVIVHCFTGTREECRQYIERGYSISVSGYILKDGADNCDEVRRCLSEGIVPLDRLMIETDAPYMGFANCRQRYVDYNQEIIAAALNSKKRKRLAQSIYPNVPSSLVAVLDKVAECLQQHDASLTRDDVAMATTKNAQRFFNFALEGTERLESDRQ